MYQVTIKTAGRIYTERAADMTDARRIADEYEHALISRGTNKYVISIKPVRRATR